MNLLELSTQILTHYKYISSGRYEAYRADKTILGFKKVNPAEIANMSLKTATVIQAIKSLGGERIYKEEIQIIRGQLTEKEKSDLMMETKSVSSWIYEIIKEISEVKE